MLQSHCAPEHFPLEILTFIHLPEKFIILRRRLRVQGKQSLKIPPRNRIRYLPISSPNPKPRQHAFNDDTSSKILLRISAYLSNKSSVHPFLSTPTRQSASPPASQSPPVNPIPPNGLHACAASPANSARPTRNLFERRWWSLYGLNMRRSYLTGLGPGKIALNLASRFARAWSWVKLASSP